MNGRVQRADARMLATYADVAVRIGLNLKSGQRLLIVGPLANGGVSLEAAPLVEAVAASAYRSGARLVEAIWGDEALQRVRFAAAPRDSFDEFSSWFPKALTEHVEDGNAVLSISANDPDQLADQDPALIGALQRAVARSVRPFRDHISRNETNWAVIAGAGAAWAAKVFPELDEELRVPWLWDTIGRLCRLDRHDPIAAWRAHLRALASRRDDLNRRQYTALKYTGPGTDLTVGLPPGHRWVSGTSTSRSGIEFCPNLPTEEVFTMPHKDRVDGTVRASKPLSHAGTTIDGFSLEFAGGRVIDLRAERGEPILRQLVETDAGAARLGEIALVPQSSPVAQSGRLFYNTLFDENAASHVALGTAYKFTFEGGELLDDEQFERAGGNRSAVHVDFMIGSGELDIDGILPNGSAEPIMRRGEWVDY